MTQPLLARDVVRLFPATGTNVTATFGDPATFDPGLFDGCEVVLSRTIED